MSGVALRGFRNRTKTVAANETGHIDVAGTYVVCLANTGAFKIGIDGGSLEDFEKGLKMRLPDGDQFRQIRLFDTSGASNTIQLAVGFGDFEDSRLTLGDGVQFKGGDTQATVADVTVATVSTDQLLAADTTRSYALVTNLDPTVTLRVGDSSAGVARGYPLAPGETVKLDTTAAIHAYNPGGAGVAVALLTIGV